ncbi:hypothetical protein [Cognatilysobacter lacus]|uniref:Uncharacterized protein n=1 Tax=Cognatilysobacter lacus TaxID=1643323 RepID=A0A5D8YYH8_9GAMM|nr:hypothetical protein [Lysobacter lacus]TZF87778.1 hypothetical protein FW784_10665 [Lysobacter lacus]
MLATTAALLPASAHAICAIEPLEPELRAADVVYVGTVVRSELARELPSAATAENVSQRRVELRHTLRPDIVFKGNPASAASVISAWQYNPPRSKRTVEFTELPVVMPGDTLLVVARTGKPTNLGLCSPTRKWSAETAGVASAVFRPAP